VHGANRLGGNGVANSTVFGGLAGDAMAPFVRAHGAHADPDPAAIEAGLDHLEAPFRRRPGDLNAIRERLYDVMWEDVGILRTGDGLRRGLAALDDLDRALDATGVADGDRAYNLTWHDWLNLKNLVLVSRSIAAAALAREDSRGAHFREDFPHTSDLATSRYTVVRLAEGGVAITTEPVHFTRVVPGETLLREAAE
jgi:fumarate reductase flavoprotein subunit